MSDVFDQIETKSSGDIFDQVSAKGDIFDQVEPGILSKGIQKIKDITKDLPIPFTTPDFEKPLEGKWTNSGKIDEKVKQPFSSPWTDIHMGENVRPEWRRTKEKSDEEIVKEIQSLSPGIKKEQAINKQEGLKDVGMLDPFDPLNTAMLLMGGAKIGTNLFKNIVKKDAVNLLKNTPEVLLKKGVPIITEEAPIIVKEAINQFEKNIQPVIDETVFSKPKTVYRKATKRSEIFNDPIDRMENHVYNEIKNRNYTLDEYLADPKIYNDKQVASISSMQQKVLESRIKNKFTDKGIDNEVDKLLSKEYDRLLYEPTKKSGLDALAEEWGLNQQSTSINRIVPEGIQKAEELAKAYKIYASDKKTASNIRYAFSGLKNGQIEEGWQVSQKVAKLAPKEQEAIQLYIDSGGNKDYLSKMAESTDERLDKIIPYSKLTYRQAYQQAINLSPDAKKAVSLATNHYNKLGNISKDIGTISELKDNYAGRMWQRNDYVKTELNKGVSTSTGHSKQRVYTNIGEGILNDKTPVTLNASKILTLNNADMARVNSAKMMMDDMIDKGIGSWQNSKYIPDGWKKVGTIQKGEDVFTAPKGIADGLKAIADPDFTAKIDSLRGIKKYQGLVKTVDLSYSFFHHFAMGMQTLYEGNYRVLTKGLGLKKILDNPDFLANRLDFVKHSGMLESIRGNQDILRNLTQQSPDIFGKITNLPGIKQTLKLAGKSSDWLFGKFQTYLKVENYSSKVSNWIAKHPDATDEMVKTAKIGFARETNAVYGGLNFEAMGVTRSGQSLLRTLLLAPDWTISNGQIVKQMFEKGTAGAAARMHTIKGILTGLALTEGINLILTGHTTDKNKPGHKFEIEIAPNVYISFFKGYMGDLVKYGSMIEQNGIAKGTSQFAQGKLAPIPRTVIGLASGVDYSGQPISKFSSDNNRKYAEYVARNAGPIPFSGGSLWQYMQKNKLTLPAALALLSGVGRYSEGSANEQFRQYIKGTSADMPDMNKLSPSGISKTATNSWKEDLVQEFGKLNLEDAIDAYDHSSKDDKKILKMALTQKLTKAGMNTPSQKLKELFKKYKEVIKE
jgi:hypothetical protein